MSLEGRTALVTGAGRGVGRGIALVLAERGAVVAINDLYAQRVSTVVSEIVERGGKAYPAVFDVTDHDAVRATVAAIESDVAPVDVLVNNAGIPEGRWSGPFVESSPADWKPYIDLNVYGAMYCIRSVLPGMCRRGWGRVVQISSGVASRGLPFGESVYGASKAAVEGLIRHVAIEVARQGVTVNALALGHMDNAADNADADAIAFVLKNTPMGRAGTPREAGEAVAYLASTAAAFVTAQVIHLNGGSFQGR